MLDFWRVAPCNGAVHGLMTKSPGPSGCSSHHDSRSLSTQTGPCIRTHWLFWGRLAKWRYSARRNRGWLIPCAPSRYHVRAGCPTVISSTWMSIVANPSVETPGDRIRVPTADAVPMSVASQPEMPLLLKSLVVTYAIVSSPRCSASLDRSRNDLTNCSSLENSGCSRNIHVGLSDLLLFSWAVWQCRAQAAAGEHRHGDEGSGCVESVGAFGQCS